MRSYIKFYSWSMLWIIPLSLVFSLGQFDTSSIIMFVIASLGIPLGLKAVPRLAGQFDFHLGKGHYTYAWLWWNLFFFFGNGVLPFTLPKEPIYIMLVWVLTMLVVVALMIGTAKLLDCWMARKERHYFIDTVLNISTYALPLPMLFLGDVMYLNLEDPIVQASLDAQGFAGLIASLYIGVVLMMLTTIGSMVLYLYPRRTALWPRVTAIVVMAVWWVATNAHILFGGYIPDIVKVWAGKALPAFTGSPLVYITPSIFEICAIALSVAIGLGIEKLWLSKTDTTI